ncbi:MAG: threonine ammonia-lyase [Nitrospirae bacterium]|nr:MAG: threonine ammonia-lyase [Nitrospirota bacterium]
MPVTIQDILAAQHILAGKVDQTPCALSRRLSELTGAHVTLKFENLQYTGSFKERGALVKLLSLTPEERARGVIAVSAGNHAQAVAYHARALGIPATIVMPRFTPNIKVEQTREYGAEVHVEGRDLDEASAFAQKFVAERGWHLIHPYDDERIIAGQGTVTLEMLDACPDLDALIVPVGGGGLIAGCAIAAKARRPPLKIIGVQTARFPFMLQALRGMPPTGEGELTIAEGIAVKTPGRLTVPIVRELVDDILLVEESDLEIAVLTLLREEKTVVEGAGASGLAAMMKYRARFLNQHVGLILTGGNIDFLILSSIIQRGLVREGRLVRLQVALRDVPGSLAAVAHCISQTDANIIEVHHQRAFSHLPVQSAEVEFVLLTRGTTHITQLLDTLSAEGYKPRRIQEEPPPL